MAKKTELIGEYIVTMNDNYSVSVSRTDSNTMEGLREATKVIGYAEDPKEKGWNTQDYGRYLVNYAQTLNLK